VQAIADAIEEALRARGARPALVEGYERGEWILIDYFDFIVHIFLPATREFYGLERLWADAERVKIK
jgi:ribosome-associated protein